MLMVVLGAGASYDSIPSRPPKDPKLDRFDYPSRLPLADYLFDDRDHFSDTMLRFPKCLPIIPYLRTPRNRTVEQALEDLQSQASKYPDGHHQLAAIRYYLHMMLWGCEHGWNAIAKGVTNYKTLLDLIDRQQNPRGACLVTFNYDRMIEDALQGMGLNIRDLPDYVRSRYNLIKLHGSVNWGHEVEAPHSEWRGMNAWELANKLIDQMPNLKLTDRFHLTEQYPMSTVGDKVLFPALAIPVQSKQVFECPTEHLDALRAFIPKTTKLLMIGWRAMEAHFLKLLADGVKHKLRVMAVAGNLEKARESVTNLRNAGIDFDSIESGGGFTDFILNREGDEFLSS